MISREKMQQVLNLEPKDQDYPPSPGPYDAFEDNWQQPIIKWTQKYHENPGQFFLWKGELLGKVISFVPLQVRIKALRALHSGCEVYLDPQSQGFLYTYNVANHRQMIGGHEWCVWGWEFLMDSEHGMFRLFLNTHNMHKHFRKLAEENLVAGNIVLKKFSNRLYEWLSPELIK